MFGYDEEVKELRGRLLAAGREMMTNAVTFYGSSSVRLWPNIENDLETESILNLGFGGSTLKACVDYYELILKPASPSVLFIYAGDNDIGDGRSPEEITQSFVTLRQKVSADFPGVQVTFISIKPSIERQSMIPEISRTNSLVASKVSEMPNTHYINIFDSMLNEYGEARKELFEEDGLHLNQTGYDLWASIIRPELYQLLRKES